MKYGTVDHFNWILALTNGEITKEEYDQKFPPQKSCMDYLTEIYISICGISPDSSITCEEMQKAIGAKYIKLLEKLGDYERELRGHPPVYRDY